MAMIHLLAGPHSDWYIYCRKAEIEKNDEGKIVNARLRVEDGVTCDGCIKKSEATMKLMGDL